MGSPKEGGNHGVTIGGRKPWSTMESQYRWKSQSSHGVIIGKSKSQSHHKKMESTESPQEGGNHRVTTGR